MKKANFYYLLRRGYFGGGGGGAPSFFDQFGTPAAAYSLRDLSGTNSAVINVRRSSDNTQADFTPTEITDGTLTAWVGVGNDGLVTTWYDQAGLNDATQATDIAQPLIVESGALVTKNGLPAVKSTAKTVLLETSFSVNANPLYSFAVFTQGTGSNTGVFGQWSPTNDFLLSGAYFFAPADIGASIFDSGGSRVNLQTGSVLPSGEQALLGLNLDGAIKIIKNGSTIGTSGAITNTRQSGNLTLFSYNTAGTASPNSLLQELIIYESDQSGNREAIETNINDHYSIY